MTFPANNLVMTRVMAQGAFDILHPGHLHYLQESAKMGDELIVVIGRDERIKRVKNIFFDEETRREMVDSLEMVDEAILGKKKDVFEILDDIEPDILSLGFDQPFDEDYLLDEFKKRGHDNLSVKRVDKYEQDEHEVVSSGKIKESILEQYGEEPFHHTQEE